MPGTAASTTTSRVLTHIHGYPRIGPRRELKFALEAYWRRETDESHLNEVVAALKRQRLQAHRLNCR